VLQYYDFLYENHHLTTCLNNICYRGFVKLWSSLTLQSTFAGIPCVLRVLQVRQYRPT